MSAALAHMDETSPSPTTTIAQGAAKLLGPPATIAAVEPPFRIGRFLSGPASIDMLCDSPARWPSLVRPSTPTQASADEVDLLSLRPVNLQVIASPLPA